MSLVKYVFVCMVYMYYHGYACSVVDITGTEVDAVEPWDFALQDRPRSSLYRYSASLIRASWLKGTRISAKEQKVRNWEGRRHAQTKLLQILRRTVS